MKNLYRFNVIGIALLLAGGCVAQAATCGFLVKVRGTVEILRVQSHAEGTVRYVLPGKNSMPILCDDVVITRENSSTKVRLQNGKIVLGPNTRVEIAGYSGAATQPTVNLIDLAYGKIRALIEKLSSSKNPQQRYFHIHTYSATTGIRGTDFFVSHDPNTSITEHATIEGEIEVVDNHTHQKVLVDAGKQAIVEGNKAAQTHPLKAEPIAESVKNEMRVTSAIVNKDPQFTTASAIETLGPPAKWVIQREAVPSNLKKIKNDF